MPATYPRIDYAARDFSTSKDALISFIKARFPDDITDFTESQLAMAVLELWAWLADMISFTIDMSVNECYLPTARQRQNLVNMVKLIGYSPKPPSAASVELKVQAMQTGGYSQNATIVKGTKMTVSDLTFEFVADYIFPANVEDAGPGSLSGLPGPTIAEGTTYIENFDGTGNPRQIYVAGNFPVIQNSEEVRVDGALWQKIEALVFAGDSDKYQSEFDGENKVTIRFGDGLSGRIPPSGMGNIEIKYRVGGGVRGNIAANLIQTRVTATLADHVTTVELLLSNPQQASGGADEESNESIKFNAPRYVRTHGNAITKQDYDTLASIFTDPVYGSIAKAAAFPRYGRTNSSANEVDVYVWARTGGGELTICSLGLKQALLAYLNERKVIVVDIFINDGQIKKIDLDVRLFVAQTIRKPEDVLIEANNAIQFYFNREELEPSKTFYVSELYHVLMSIPGVLQVSIGKPDTSMEVLDVVLSSFVLGLSTEIIATTGGFILNRFAGGIIKFTSGSLSGKSYPILSNTINSIKVDAILSLVVGNNFALSSMPEMAQDIPVAENEIYQLGTLNLSAHIRLQDTRESILVATL
jgi:hypothetical protein